MSWIGNIFTSNHNSTSTTSVTGGTYGAVGATVPSTLPYTTPTTHIVGTTPNMGIYNPNQNFTYTTTGLADYSSHLHISGKNPVIMTDKGTLDLNELITIVDTLKERLLILTPNFEKHEKYAALKKAYDNYKLIESMLSGEDDDNK